MGPTKYSKSVGPPHLQVGSLAVDEFGDLETISDFKTYLCPIGFASTRVFWSTKDIGRKCVYSCRIYSAAEFRTREGGSLAAKAYLDKLQTQRLVVIDDDGEMRVVSAAIAQGLAQLDGQNDAPFDAKPPTLLNLPPPSANNSSANRGIIRMSTNVNTGGIKLFQKVGSSEMNASSSSAKKITNQILLNNLSNQSSAAAGGSEKPKVLKMGRFFLKRIQIY